MLLNVEGENKIGNRVLKIKSIILKRMHKF
ncbi:hypothetical protein C5S31_08470 [ANME-1 cluster archaeon GoMg2]|nr:hypothetical protein [ANME-1 cluster archaeon GoMg2]